MAAKRRLEDFDAIQSWKNAHVK
ncbi:hypothetical protein CCACVL1_28323 [Corchorus capsularis]|uniref:Uncharacterized protein n=1 Tax=Corchorus capsularis TaxID=210143 RepID=A0A1R3G701_COCAP|nr:hypothetical protein CCACVL1_28323 [Corchorus capsularis]